MGPGEIFEEFIYREFQEAGIFIKRIKTRLTRFKGDNEIADFYAYADGYLIYLEAKSTKAKSFPFGMIQPTQAVGLKQATQYKGVYGGILLELRSFDRYFYIPIETIDYIIRSKKVSMNLEDLERWALEINREEALDLKDIGKRIREKTLYVRRKEK